MKVLLIITLLGYASCGRLDSSYLPPHQNAFGRSSGAFGAGSGSFGHSGSASGTFGAGSGSFGHSGSASGTFGAGSSSFGHSGSASGAFAATRIQPSASAYSGSYSTGSYSGSGQQIPILRLDEENNGDGTYRFNYETANGISAQEQGDARADGTRSHGGFSYTAPDGQQIHIQYTADENGFQAQGPHIPTPPPVPEAIQRSVEQNLADEARGVVDDGQYRAGQEGQYRSGHEGQYSSAGAGGYFGAGGKFAGSNEGHQHGGYRY